MTPNLTDLIVLNINPLDIFPNINPRIWNAFQKFIVKKNLYNSPLLNPGEGNSKLALQLIEEYNTSVPLNSIITTNDILAAQKYHLITNPGKILTDGRLGSQTSQMKYPERAIYYAETIKNGIVVPKSSDGLIPIIWGNKRYVISAQIVYDYAIKGLSYPSSKLVIFNPLTHNSTLQRNSLPRIWDTLDSSTTVNNQATGINNITENIIKQKNNIQNQINIIKSIK